VPRGLGQLELPEELVDAIFGQIDDAQTAFRLGVANTRLLIIGERRIKQLLGDPSWSGDRVICIRGGDSDSEDEDEDGGDGDGDGENGGDGEGDGEEGGTIDLPEGLDTGEVYGRFDPPAAYRWQPSSSKDLSHGLQYYNLESRIAHALSTPVPAHERPPDADAAAASTVVWNLTKHVYVRADAIPAAPDALPEAWGYWFDSGDSSEDRENILGWILLLHVTWTDSEWVARGKWAGDRIERTGQDVLETRLKDDGCKWTDVSEDAVRLFVDAYNAMS